MTQAHQSTCQYIAICPNEFRDIVAEDLLSLGAYDVEEGYKSVYFKANLDVAYRIHLSLQTASRILHIQREGYAKDKFAIFFQSTKVKWDSLLDSKTSFCVEGVAGDRGEDAPSSNEISKAIRESIQKQFARYGKHPPKVDLKDPQITIVGFYHQKRICISIDTSGKSLHKRGYKVESHPAPVKEHIAASLLKAIKYDGTQLLWDPMCGSGTFAIEAAFMNLDKSCLIHRKKGEFGFEHVKTFDAGLFRRVQDELRQQKHAELNAPIYASDISDDFVAMTKSNALRARVERHIKIFREDFLSSKPIAKKGILILNLPYGTRLGDRDNLEDFYSKVGAKLKSDYTNWTAALLVSNQAPWQQIGLKSSKKINLENGGIPCKLLVYDLFKGSRKDFLESEKLHDETLSN